MTPYRSTFDLKPGPGLLTFGCADRPDCLLSDSGFSFTLLQDGRETRADIRRLASINAPLGAEERGLGLDNLKTLAWTDEASGLTGELVLGNPAGEEYLCLSMKLSNTSSQTRVLQGIDLLSAGSLAEQGGSELPFATADRQEDLAFFSNGWQSWSYSAAFGAAEKQPRAMLGFIPNAASTNPFTPVFREPGRFSADLVAVLGNRRTRAGLLCGFL
ncbi:MAG: hypothetical protein AAGU05_06935, partial [Anaerolineaceae bacterium]